MSLTASRPPGLRTRKISRKTAGLSGARLSTQLEMTRSRMSSDTVGLPGRSAPSLALGELLQLDFGLGRADLEGLLDHADVLGVVGRHGALEAADLQVLALDGEGLELAGRHLDLVL